MSKPEKPRKKKSNISESTQKTEIYSQQPQKRGYQPTDKLNTSNPPRPTKGDDSASKNE